MDEKTEQQNGEKVKKTNTKLAVAIGIFGMGAFGLLYVLFFAVMIVRPGLLFSIMPFPALTSSAVSDGTRTWLLSQKPDMNGFSPREKRPPETKHFIALLEGASTGPEIEVPAYAEAIGADNRLIFLSEGVYRTYDGVKWTEVKIADIGSDPVGAVSPDGMYVMSGFKEGSRLCRINNNVAAAISLPPAFVDAEKKTSCLCARIVWYRGALCLFWRGEGSMAWTTWNGSQWAAPAVSPQFSGGFAVAADGQRLFFFNRHGEGTSKVLSYYVFENNDWSGPIDLPLAGGFMDWDVFLQQGKLKLFIQQFSKSMLYTIANNRLEDPVQLGSSFDPVRMIGSLALFVIGMNAAIFLAIFGVSAVINRYKSRSWTEGEASYEFASLFRRFIAMFIDNLLLMLPPAFAIALLLPFKDFSRNPFGPLLFVFAMTCFFFVGGFLYHSLLEGLLGQTLGKKICGIRVLKADFTPCGLSAGFLRNLMRIVDAFFYYLAATVCLSATLKWQRLGDLVAETVVVRQKKMT